MSLLQSLQNLPHIEPGSLKFLQDLSNSGARRFTGRKLRTGFNLGLISGLL